MVVDIVNSTLHPYSAIPRGGAPSWIPGLDRGRWEWGNIPTRPTDYELADEYTLLYIRIPESYDQTPEASPYLAAKDAILDSEQMGYGVEPVAFIWAASLRVACHPSGIPPLRLKGLCALGLGSRYPGDNRYDPPYPYEGANDAGRYIDIWTPFTQSTEDFIRAERSEEDETEFNWGIRFVNPVMVTKLDRIILSLQMDKPYTWWLRLEYSLVMRGRDMNAIPAPTKNHTGWD